MANDAAPTNFGGKSTLNSRKIGIMDWLNHRNESAEISF